MSTYGDMQSAIADEINRSDLTTQIQRAIQEAIRQLERQRFYFNECRATAETVADQEFYQLPTDFLYDDIITITHGNSIYPLNRRSHQWLEDYYTNDTSTGIPDDYELYTNQLRLKPVPNDVYTLNLSYVKRLGALVDSGDENAWTNEAYDLTKSIAKQYLYVHYLRNYQNADALNTSVRQSFMQLQQETERRILRGRIQPTAF